MSLAIPGSGIPEHKALLSYFLRHHPGSVRAVLIGVDDYTCRAGPITRKQLQGGPFPFWLYAAQLPTYMMGAFRLDVLEAAVSLLLGRGGSIVRSSPKSGQ